MKKRWFLSPPKREETPENAASNLSRRATSQCDVRWYTFQLMRSRIITIILRSRAGAVSRKTNHASESRMYRLHLLKKWGKVRIFLFFLEGFRGKPTEDDACDDVWWWTVYITSPERKLSLPPRELLRLELCRLDTVRYWVKWQDDN